MYLYADLVFKNGQVVTVNPTDDIVTCVAARDEKILYVGDDAGVEEFIGPDTKVVDLKGRTLTPGFIDSHVHMTQIGAHQIEVDLTYPNVLTIADVKAKIKAAAQKAKKGEWIRCFGYNQDFLEEKRHPNRWDLDEVAPDNPVVLVRVCVHVSVFNSYALKMANIADDAPDEPGGVFDRDENGVVNGVMRENVHFARNQCYFYTEAELTDIFVRANQYLIERGITSVSDAGGVGAPQVKVMLDLHMAKKLDVRINMMFFALSDATKLFWDTLPTGIHTNFGDNKLKIGPAKMMLDGSSSAPTASVRRPYDHKDDGDCGILTTDQAGVDEFFEAANRAGFQGTSHAVGDNAVEMIITGIERALASFPRENHRHRIEHCGIVDDAMIARIKAAGIVPISQPGFVYVNGESYLKYYGEERVSMMMAVKSLMDAGVTVALSTDDPVVPCDPMITMYAACTRKSAHGKEICPVQCIKPLEAIRMYTLNGAYASFEEDIKGSLEVGKLADFTVLTDAILEMDPNNYLNVHPAMTIIAGKVVWEA